MSKWILGLSKTKKIFGGIISSSALITALITLYTWKMDGISASAEASEHRIIKYVDDKNAATILLFNTNIKHITKSQGEIKNILKTMNNRLYELNGRKNGQ